MTDIRLVPMGLEHLAAIREIMRDPEVLRFTRTPDPMPDGWMATWFARFGEDDRAGFAILEDDEVVGYAVAASISWDDLEAELGYAIGPQGRGRGVATETLRLLTGWAFDEGMERASLLISVDNPASSRVAEKAGYTFEGVLRSLHQSGGRRGDMQCWSMLPDELDRGPSTPVIG